MAAPMTKPANRQYDAFVDPDSRTFLATLTARLGPGTVEKGSWLRPVFPGHPGMAQALIYLSAHDSAAGTPVMTCVAAGGSGGQMSSGDRASLPGRSTRYRVIWLVCAHCGVKMACLFYDEGDIPVCANALHGQLEILR